MKTDGNDLAYPANQTINDCDGNFMATISHAGLTKREYFALHILSGMVASTPGCVGESCVYFAVKEADELITELNKEVEK